MLWRDGVVVWDMIIIIVAGLEGCGKREPERTCHDSCDVWRCGMCVWRMGVKMLKYLLDNTIMR